MLHANYKSKLPKSHVTLVMPNVYVVHDICTNIHSSFGFLKSTINISMELSDEIVQPAKVVTNDTIKRCASVGDTSTW